MRSKHNFALSLALSWVVGHNFAIENMALNNFTLLHITELYSIKWNAVFVEKLYVIHGYARVD